MMSQFMAQGGQGISGNAIKWRKTSVNVPFSPFSGNLKMFLSILGPIIMVFLLPMEEEMGAPEEKRKTLKRAPQISSLLLHKILFFLPLAWKKKKKKSALKTWILQ